MPPAAWKRLPHSYKTVVPVSVDHPFRVLGPELADYLWITGPLEEVHPPRLGIQVKTLPENQGLEVTAVNPGSAAQRAGLQVGDVIVKIENEAVGTVEDLHRVLAKHPPQVRFILRRAGKEETIEVGWAKQRETQPR